MNAEGVLRVLRDVVVSRGAAQRIVAISSEAGLAGEVLTIQLASEANVPTVVRVVESQPVMIAGHLRHRLELERVERAPDAATSVEPTAIREAE